MMSVAVITARGGSKRIPRKNIRPFCGRPMIAWPIAAALASGCFDHVLVSTDDEEIAGVSRACGAEVPFLRPARLSDDYTPAHKAARHMLEWAIAEFGACDSFAHIYPTAPMLLPEDILQGRKLVEAGNMFAYTAQKISFPVYQIVMRDAEGNILPLFPPEKARMRSQDMPETFIDAGQLYYFNTNAFLREETALSAGVALILLPAQRALDIDTEEDWRLAEKMAALSGLA
ncbi:MAG: pseudaminic acid cytidylyltransferase [Desulfovibrio sp.]|jgi:N-acylneuraminate cytidylyltransferase|nr:pseudaminic acid cytidylyltransferase [Desulfovibrio sp.]